MSVNSRRETRGSSEKRSSFVSLATAALARHTAARAATAPPHVSLVPYPDRRARGVGVLGRARLFADRRALVDQSLHSARRRSSAASAVFSAVFGGRGRRLDPAGRAWSPFPFPYWGPQGVIIGPPWFGAGVGGGNWRVIPNRTPFGPPARLRRTSSTATCATSTPCTRRARRWRRRAFEPVPVCSGVPVRGVHVPPGHEHNARLDAGVPQGRRRERVRAPALLQAAGRLRRDRVSRVGPAQAESSRGRTSGTTARSLGCRRASRSTPLRTGPTTSSTGDPSWSASDDSRTTSTWSEK